MTVQNPAIFIQAGSHPAEDVRRFIGATFGNRDGIVAAGDLVVSQSATPAMSVLVQGGQAVIQGSEGTYQGAYFVENRGTATLAVAASDATNARRDIIVAKVQDAAYATGPSSLWSLAVVTGTPAASPADPALPANSIALARVTVAAASTTVTNASITDLRVSGNLGRATALGGTIVTVSGSRPVTPSVGTMIYETDTGQNLVYYGATTGWRRPWGQPWGVQGTPYAGASNVTLTTTGATGFQVATFPDVANRRYRFTLSGQVANLAAGASQVTYQLNRGATGILTMPAPNYQAGDVSGYSYTGTFTTSATATSTYSIQVAYCAGSIRWEGASTPNTLLIEDIGPTTSTAPTA